MRFMIVSDGDMASQLQSEAQGSEVETQAAEVREEDLRFGLAEVAAIIAIAHSSVQVAELLAKAYKQVKKRTKVVIKTARGSVTIEGDKGLSAEDILKEINQANFV